MEAAEGASATHNGALNAQAKGLTTATDAMFRHCIRGVPYWREVAITAIHRRSKPASPGESLRYPGQQGQRTSFGWLNLFAPGESLVP